MPKRIDVYGLTADEVKALRCIALKRYGKASVSLLAKKALLAMLETGEPVADMQPDPSGKRTRRITLNLPVRDCRYLDAAAKERHGSVNDTGRDIIQSHIRRHPFISQREADALYQSNAQLLRIGRNINQIARQMNAGENISLTTRHILDLKAFIDAHTETVARVLSNNRRQ